MRIIEWYPGLNRTVHNEGCHPPPKCGRCGSDKWRSVLDEGHTWPQGVETGYWFCPRCEGCP